MIIDEQEQLADKDELAAGWQIASFCFPIVGAILYFTKKNKEPESAKRACHLALISFGLSVFVRIIMMASR